MARMPMLVDSVKKFHRQVPHSSEIGNVGVPSVNLRNRTNTTYMTANSINGLSTDHRMPRNDPWYLSWKSVFTSSRNTTSA